MKCCKEDTKELLVSLIIALIHSGIFPDCKIEKSNKREEQAVLLFIIPSGPPDIY